MENEIINKLHVVESLQIREFKTYERFLMTLEKHVRELLPNINQPTLLNEMMGSKKNMMDEIETIEEELSPFRKELAGLSAEGRLKGLDVSLVDKIKKTDLTIIELISRISRAEQELMNKIKEQMELIKDRLQHASQQNSLEAKYGKGKKIHLFRPAANGDPAPSQFDTTG